MSRGHQGNVSFKSCAGLDLTCCRCRKVAWEELSLECSGSREDSPVRVSSRPQTPEIGNFRENRESRLDFVKTFINTNSDNNNSGSHKERYNQN